MRHARTLFGQYNLPTQRRGWYRPATQTVDLDFTFNGTDQDNPIDHSIFLHECIHYWQGVGTTYGFYFAEVASLEAQLVLGALRELRQGGIEKIHVPIRQWAHREENAKLQTSLIILCKHFDMITSHINSLEGGCKSEDPGETISTGDWNAILAYLETGLRPPTREDVAEDRHLTVPNGQLAPGIVGNDGAVYWLGARALSEAHAFCCQVRLASPKGGFYVPESKSDEFMASLASMFNDPTYTLATKMLQDMLLTVVPGVEIQDAWELLPSLVDLALNGPLLPELRDQWLRQRSGNSVLNWRDAHPGFRFIQILIALRECGVLTKVPVMRPTAIDAICAHLRWPTPVEIAQEINEVMTPEKKHGSAFLRLVDKGEKQGRYVVGLDMYDFRLQVLNDLSRLRIDSPDVVACPNSMTAVRRLSEISMPSLIRQPGKKSGGVPGRVAETWGRAYDIANGLVDDGQFLRSCIEDQEYREVLEGVYKVNPKNINWI